MLKQEQVLAIYINAIDEFYELTEKLEPEDPNDITLAEMTDIMHDQEMTEVQILAFAEVLEVSSHAVETVLLAIRAAYRRKHTQEQIRCQYNQVLTWIHTGDFTPFEKKAEHA